MQGLFYVQLYFSYNLHIVVTIAQHAWDRVLKRVLKLSKYRLQIFLVKYEKLRSLQQCEGQGIRGKLKKHAILATEMETRLYIGVLFYKCQTRKISKILKQ